MISRVDCARRGWQLSVGAPLPPPPPPPRAPRPQRWVWSLCRGSRRRRRRPAHPITVGNDLYSRGGRPPTTCRTDTDHRVRVRCGKAAQALRAVLRDRGAQRGRGSGALTRRFRVSRFVLRLGLVLQTGNARRAARVCFFLSLFPCFPKRSTFVLFGFSESHLDFCRSARSRRCERTRAGWRCRVPTCSVTFLLNFVSAS